MHNDFTGTTFWNNSIQIAEIVFNLTNDLPRKEDYGLTSQLRRASVSISANIAEAFKNKFYDYARGSAFETKNLLLYGVRVKHFDVADVQQMIELIEQTIHEINEVKVSLK